jgi:tRNA threonylcarbamoyl adenosine modification protein YjeE
MLITLTTADDTEAFGAQVASWLQPGDVVTLSGDLGAGKTTLVRGLVHALCGQEATSPTYTLVHTYGAAPVIWHFDAYRLAHPDQIFEAGWDEALGSGIVLIEWPDKIADHLPADRLEISLDHAGEHRHVRLTGTGKWACRIPYDWADTQPTDL